MLLYFLQTDYDDNLSFYSVGGEIRIRDERRLFLP